MIDDELDDDQPLEEIEGYKILKLRPRYLPSGSYKVLYFKAHESKAHRNHAADDDDDDDDDDEQNGPSDLPVGRTVFATNPSFYFQESDFEAIFRHAGHIERVLVGSFQREGHRASFFRGGCAHVVFTQAKALRKALAWTEADARKISCPAPPQLGIAAWVAEYRNALVPAAILQQRSDVYLSNFDKLQQEKREQDAIDARPDEDGWIKVVKSSKRKARRAHLNPATAAQSGDFVVRKDNAKSSAKVLDDFYKFQKREQRRKELEQLRTTFQDEKSRISKMQGDRRFRP